MILTILMLSVLSLGVALVHPAFNLPELAMQKVAKAHNDFLKHGRMLFSCCDDEEVDVFIDCDTEILPGFSCEICFVPTCKIERFGTAILDTYNPNGKRLRFAPQLVDGILWNTISAQIDTIEWTSSLGGEKGANYLIQNLKFKLRGVTDMSTLEGSTIGALCRFLNKQTTMSIRDCNGQQWMFGDGKRGLCLSAGGVTINKETNEINFEFEAPVALHSHRFALPKAA